MLTYLIKKPLQPLLSISVLFTVFIFPGNGSTKVHAQAASKRQAFSAKDYRFMQETLQRLPWLLNGDKLKTSQVDVFQDVQAKAEKTLAVPKAPANALMNWQYYRYYPQGDDTDISVAIDPKAFYTLIGEDLLLAQTLLHQSDFRQQRRGLQLMYRTALNCDMRLKDSALTPRIYDAFILPYLEAATPDAVDAVSRTALLQNACGVYKKAGQTKKFETSLQVLVSLANAANASRTRDWARYTLALSYAERKRFDEAIKTMKLVSTPGLVPGKKELLKDWAVQKEKADQSTASPEN